MTTSIVEPLNEVFIDLTEKASITVLYVDAEFPFLKVAKEYLEMEGPFKVETAFSAKEAMNKLNKKIYDIVVSDYKMLEKDGLQLLRELRKKGNHIPFIILTGKGMEETAIKTLNLGADQYVNKVEVPEIMYGKLANSILKTVKSRQEEKAQVKSEEKYRGFFEKIIEAFVYIIYMRPMKWTDVLIYASGFSYIAAAVATLGGYPALDTGFLPNSLQIVFYLVMPLLLAISQLFKPLKWVLAGIYGVAAMLSFSGVQPWVNYYGDSSILGPAMAAWDLTLAVALLEDS